MIYSGADHYFFWKGIEQAQKDNKFDLYEYLEDFNHAECGKAFELGFILGQCFSKNEYLELTINNGIIPNKPKKNKKDIVYQELVKEFLD